MAARDLFQNVKAKLFLLHALPRLLVLAMVFFKALREKPYIHPVLLIILLVVALVFALMLESKFVEDVVSHPDHLEVAFVHGWYQKQTLHFRSADISSIRIKKTKYNPFFRYVLNVRLKTREYIFRIGINSDVKELQHLIYAFKFQVAEIE